MQVPLSSAQILEEDIQAVVDTLRSGRIALGPQIRAFEEEIAARAGVSHAVACSSGTAALHILLEASGIGPGDVVLTTPFSFVASSNVLLMLGAIPYFVDISRSTLMPSVPDVEWALARLRSGSCVLPGESAPCDFSRVKGMLFVDVFGMPAPWEELDLLARQEGLLLFEDSCEALGGRLEGRSCGSFGVGGAFAFYPNKQITTGEGGVVVTENPEIASLCRSLINQGRDDSGTWLSHVRLGYNYRMSELTAALGRSQLSRLDAILEKRNQVALRYQRLLGHLPGLILPSPPAWTDLPSWFVYVIRLRNSGIRQSVMEHLLSRGVECKPYFTPIPLQPFYAERFGHKEGDFPVMDEVCSSVLALPFYTDLDEASQSYVARCLEEALSHATL
ncbi:MAG TPA: DegT/DnrJ/EryC1/StrS family aminotransferase [Synergistaceae bacterium]|nr:DegT/DnrJ/EryC1/StrS family aminotransferase [Synergistaceae bacterium]